MFTIPNQLTLLRVALVPLFAAALFFDTPYGHEIALALFLIAAATDWFDGYLARRLQSHSEFGRMLDPIADKLMVGVALVMLVAEGAIAGAALWPALVILAREILVSGLREFLGQLQVSVPVSRISKWKTGVQMAALAFLLTPDWAGGWPPLLGAVLLWAAAGLTVYTGFAYLRAALRHVQPEARS